MKSALSFPLGLAIGVAACGSVAILRADLGTRQVAAPPAAVVPAAGNDQVGRYREFGQAGARFLLDTTTGQTWISRPVDGGTNVFLEAWVPANLPPAAR